MSELTLTECGFTPEEAAVMRRIHRLTREPVAGCPQPEPAPYRPIVYVPPAHEKRVARSLLQHIHEATPGGLRPEQFRPVRHPLKSLLAAFPFVALAAALVALVVARHA